MSHHQPAVLTATTTARPSNTTAAAASPSTAAGASTPYSARDCLPTPTPYGHRWDPAHRLAPEARRAQDHQRVAGRAAAHTKESEVSSSLPDPRPIQLRTWPCLFL